MSSRPEPQMQELV